MNPVNLDVSTFLQTSGYTLGTDLFVSHEPESPDVVTSLHNLAGTETACLDKSIYQQTFFQVRARANEYLSAHTNMNAIKTILDYAEIGDIGGASYGTLEPQGTPIDLQMDTNDRRIVTQTYAVIRYPEIVTTGGAWTPADITTLAWYDASDASTITEAAGAVSQWDDKSGNSRDVVQATGSKQPLWNLSDSINFNGTTETLNNAVPFMFANGEVDIFAVSTLASAGSQQGVVFESNTGGQSGNGAYTIFASARSPYGDRMGCQIRKPDLTFDLQYDFMTDTGSFNNALHMYLCRDTGTSVVGYYDGLVGGTSAYSRSAGYNFNLFSIGISMPMNVREIVITSNLSDADRQTMEGYLAWKWGLEANLPVGHPYLTEAP
jgi:hypothetical protein